MQTTEPVNHETNHRVLVEYCRYGHYTICSCGWQGPLRKGGSSSVLAKRDADKHLKQERDIKKG